MCGKGRMEEIGHKEILGGNECARSVDCSDGFGGICIFHNLLNCTL